MYPIVIEKNKLQNELDSCRIQLAVLQKKREDLIAKRRKMNEITSYYPCTLW